MCHNYNLSESNLLREINDKDDIIINSELDLLLKKLNELNKKVYFLENSYKKNVKINMGSELSLIIENINNSIEKLDEKIIQNGMIQRNVNNKNIVLEYL